MPNTKSLALFVFAIIILLGVPRVVRSALDTNACGDFLAYYFAAYRVSEGITPYPTISEAERLALWASLQQRFPELAEYQAPPYYLYPPLFSLALVPLTKLDPLTAKQIWSLASLIMLGICLILVGDMVPQERKLLVGLGLAAIVVITPTVRVELLKGQADIATLTATCAALWFYLRRRSTTISASLLVVAAFIKLVPACVGLYYLVRRRWSYVAWMVMATVVFGALTWHVFGWKVYSDYLTRVLPLIGENTLQVGNQTLPTLFRQLFMRLHNHWATVPCWPGNVLSLLSRVTVLLASIWALVRMSKPQDRYSVSVMQGWSLLLVGGLLCSTCTWSFAWVWALLPLGAILGDDRTWKLGWRFWAILSIAFLLTQYQPRISVHYLCAVIPYLCVVGAITLFSLLVWLVGSGHQWYARDKQ